MLAQASLEESTIMDRSQPLTVGIRKDGALYLTGRKWIRGISLAVAGHPIKIRKEARDFDTELFEHGKRFVKAQRA